MEACVQGGCKDLERGRGVMLRFFVLGRLCAAQLYGKPADVCVFLWRVFPVTMGVQT